MAKQFLQRVQASDRFRPVIAQLPPNPGFPAPDASQEKFKSRLVVPTFFRSEPFGEHAEALFVAIARLETRPSSLTINLDFSRFRTGDVIPFIVGRCAVRIQSSDPNAIAMTLAPNTLL